MPTNDTIETLSRFVTATTTAEIPVAIGGGVAVNAYGVKRETTDVDAFLRDEDRPAIWSALREAGFRIGKIQPPFHYIAMLPGVDDPDIRVDLLFPVGEPELSAIDSPVPMEVWSVEAPVFPVTLLVLSKLIAIADSPERGVKDRADLEELYNVGAFEPEAIRYAIDQFDPGLHSLFNDIITRTRRTDRGSGRGFGHWRGGRR
jgi:hypothetical protein